MDQARLTLDSHRLNCFQAVAATGSIRGAAERLGVEPSVVSRQVRQLEAQLGVELLERRGRGVVPTEAAKIVLEHCNEQLVSEQLLRTRLEDLQGLRGGELRVVAGDGFVEEFLSEVLGPFRARYPMIDLVLEAGGADDVVRAVADDRAHIGITLCAPANDRVAVLREWAQPLCLVACPEHPVAASNSPPTLAALRQHRVALAVAGTGLRTLVARAELLEGVQLNPDFTANSVGALKQYALQGLGVTFLSLRAVRREVADGRLVCKNVANPILQAATAQLVARKGRHRSVALRKLLDALLHSDRFRPDGRVADRIGG